MIDRNRVTSMLLDGMKPRIIARDLGADVAEVYRLSDELRDTGVLPRPEAAADRIRAWFESNPAEALSMADIAARFEVAEAYARKVVAALTAEGVIQGAYVYALNPERKR